MLPVLTYTQPSRGADALRWRQRPCRIAEERAGELGLEAPRSRGARSAARSPRATGRPGTAAFHINADIADAVVRYLDATGDDDFERDVGVELLVETARLWRSLGHHDLDGGSASTA